MKLPPGYTVKWTGQYELLERVRERMAYVIPLTLGIVFLILYMNFRGVPQTLLVMTAIESPQWRTAGGSPQWPPRTFAERRRTFTFFSWMEPSLFMRASLSQPRRTAVALRSGASVMPARTHDRNHVVNRERESAR